MASPLSWFRKYQRSLLVVFGVLLMVTFLLADVANRLSGNGGRRADENPVLVSWKGGEVKRNELRQMRAANYQAAVFTSKLFESAASRMSNTYVRTAMPIENSTFDGMEEDSANQAVFQTFIMAEKAKELGVVVNEKTVDAYLDALANEDLSDSDYQAIAKEVFNQGGYYYSIKKHLELELAAIAYDQMMRSGLYWNELTIQRPEFGMRPITIRPAKAAVSPTERWQGYVKTNKYIDCQVYPLEIADFIDDVDDEPSVNELKDLYEEGKDRFGNQMKLRVNSKGELQPGFKLPYRVSISHFRIDPTIFIEIEKQKITPEEVKAEYDRLVAEKSPLVTGFQPFSIDNPALNSDQLPKTPNLDSNENESGSSNGEGNEKVGSDGGFDPNAAKTDDKKSDSNEEGIPDPPTLDSNEQKEQGSEKSGQSENNKSEQNSGGQKSGGEKSDDQNSGNGQITFEETTYVSFQESGAQQDNKDQQETVSNQENQDSTGENQDDQKSGDPETSEQKSEGGNQQDPIPQPPTDIQQDDAFKPNDLPPTPEGVEPTVPQQEQGPVIKPLTKELEDTIRANLANAPGLAEYEKAKNNLNQVISDYYVDYKIASEEEDLEPEEFDGERLAEKFMAQYFETDLVDEFQLKSTPFGKSINVASAFAAARRMELFRHQEIDGDGTSKYLFWVTERLDPEIPEFEDVKDDIEKYWKYCRAYDLAIEKGKEICNEIAQSNKQESETKETLKIKFLDKAIQTGSFPWIATNPQFRITEEVKNPGEEFMRAAFSLDQLECATAPNGDRSIIYVIQLIKDFEGTVTTTETLFMDMLERTNGLQTGNAGMMSPQQDFENVAIGYRQRALGRLANDLYDSMEVSWQK